LTEIRNVVCPARPLEDFYSIFEVKSFSFNEKEERVKDDKEERPDA